MNIFVSNLSFSVRDEDLKGFLTPYGEVTSARVISDKFTGKSKGFGFVEMSDTAAGKKAIAALDNNTLDNKVTKVVENKPKEEQPYRKNIQGSSIGFKRKW